jgi:hypothetical protein
MSNWYYMRKAWVYLPGGIYIIFNYKIVVVASILYKKCHFLAIFAKNYRSGLFLNGYF